MAIAIIYFQSIPILLGFYLSAQQGKEATLFRIPQCGRVGIPLDGRAGWHNDHCCNTTQNQYANHDGHKEPAKIGIFDFHHLLFPYFFSQGNVRMASTLPIQCSPALHRRAGETCLPTTSLERLANIWNKKYPRNKIPVGKKTRKSKNDQDAGNRRSVRMWRNLQSAMRKELQCETEYCLVKRIDGLDEPSRQTMIKSYFRPEKPKAWAKNPRQWLDSYNIEDVMQQFEEADPSFEFIGPVPIDFNSKIGMFGKCIVEELCKLDLKTIAEAGKKKIGIIFNLDKHDEPGSHWVCAYVDLPKRSAYYFDSYGFEPQQEIVDFLKRCKEQGCDQIFYNDIRHQRKGSECGMYCLYVIICLLHGKPFYNICKNVMEDDTMVQFRDILFATETPSKEAIQKAVDTLCMLKEDAMTQSRTVKETA
jgi:hypothetical protein